MPGRQRRLGIAIPKPVGLQPWLALLMLLIFRFLILNVSRDLFHIQTYRVYTISLCPKM